MNPQAVSNELELEQAHALLDSYAIERIDVDSQMMLSLKGRLEILIERMLTTRPEPQS